jgi:hypothetical protein
MHNSERCRYNAAECLKAARAANDYRRLYILMARTWLALARHDETIQNMLANWRAEDETRTASSDAVVVWLDRKSRPGGATPEDFRVRIHQ